MEDDIILNFATENNIKAFKELNKTLRLIDEHKNIPDGESGWELFDQERATKISVLRGIEMLLNPQIYLPEENPCPPEVNNLHSDSLV